MEVYRKATKSMADEIIQVMSGCFKEPIWVLKFFFEERFDINNCHVCIVDGKIVSVAHAMPSKIKLIKEIVNGIYIYGACTLDGYRNQGFMGKLLKYVHTLYAQKGYECAFLVPERESLCDFYSELGYQNFFKIRRLELTKAEILEMCGGVSGNFENDKKYCLNFYYAEKLRLKVYDNKSVVQYTEKDIRFASRLYELFNSGGLISTNCGYGICGFVGEGELKVRDFTCKEAGTLQLLKKIYSKFPDQKKYIIETQTGNKFFKNLGKICNHGMILPLSPLCDAIIKSISDTSSEENSPYLAISLE